MYCNNCGKKVDEDSKFCQFCGARVDIADDSKPKAESENQKEEVKETETKSKADQLWDKFAEVYDAQDKEREKYDALTSIHIWDIIQRLSTNAFETFITESKDELNSQPYKAIEAIKNLYAMSVLGGYRLWIAEALLEEQELGKFKSFKIDNLIDDWKDYDFDKSLKELSEEMGICISKYVTHRVDSFMDNTPTMKDVSNATVEKLRSSIMWQIVSGYNAGQIESKYRK
jgi:hypothetical protein